MERDEMPHNSTIENEVLDELLEHRVSEFELVLRSWCKDHSISELQHYLEAVYQDVCERLEQN